MCMETLQNIERGEALFVDCVSSYQVVPTRAGVLQVEDVVCGKRMHMNSSYDSYKNQKLSDAQFCMSLLNSSCPPFPTNPAQQHILKYHWNWVIMLFTIGLSIIIDCGGFLTFRKFEIPQNQNEFDPDEKIFGRN